MRKLTCAVMRGGTSKGAYFLREQLPHDDDAMRRVLLAVMGSPDPRQIDGLGGGEMLTSKVAMVARSPDPDADIDYYFAQVVPGESRVDTAPTCGNILSGVGAFAIEFGMHPASDGETALVVRDMNTGAFVEQVVQTPGGEVRYDGDCAISGAPGAAAPVALKYLRFAGAKTGKLFPTGNVRDDIGGVAATCLDAAMPVVFAAASDFGLSGRETTEALKADAKFFSRMEAVRLAASERMGMGDARGKVVPKFALVFDADDASGGDIGSRYFTPVSPHAAYAVSGGIALSVAATTGGTVAADFYRKGDSGTGAGSPSGTDSGANSDSPSAARIPVRISHPSGVMEIDLEYGDDGSGNARVPMKAGVVRTARMLMTGEARVPESAFE